MGTQRTATASFVGALSAPLGRVARTSTCLTTRRARARVRCRSAPRACAASDAAQVPPAPAGQGQGQADESAPAPARAEAEPVAVRAARAVWRVGWLAWWGQLVLTVVAGVILGFAALFPGARVSASASAPGLALSVGCAACAAVAWAWTYVYTRASLRLAAPTTAAGASELDNVAGALRGAVVLGILGCAVGLVALQATVGALLARSFAAGAAGATAAGGLLLAPNAVQPVDLLVAQAAVNALCSLFIGLAAALWLQGRVRKWKEQERLWSIE